MKKIIRFSLLGLIALLIIGGYIGIRYFHHQWFKDTPNYLSFTSEYHPVNFDWVQTKYGEHTELHDAMKIPVKIPGAHFKLYMQFDTGSPFTFVKKNPIKSLKEYGKKWEDHTLDEKNYLKDFAFEIDENQLNASLMRVLYSGKEIDLTDTVSWYSLGTIGSDIMADKITIIDFKNQNISFYDERPSWIPSSSTFKPFDFQGRRLMLPASIQGKNMELFYDSGTSAFGLLTSKNRFDDYTNESEPEISYDANSHGNSVPVYHKNSTEKITIGGAELGLKRISYVDWHDKFQGFFSKFTKIGGWLGNKPFTESTLIIDAKKEEFLVISNGINVE